MKTAITLPTPDCPGGLVMGLLELPDGTFTGSTTVREEDWPRAAYLSERRLKRCKVGSHTWHWHRAVIAENDRRRRSRLTILSGGAP